MELRKVVDCKEDDERIKKLYEEAFPPIERFPYWILKRRVSQGITEMWNIFNEDTWIGWTYIIKYINKEKKKFAYVLFFAIDANYRNKGYGSQALKLIFENYKDYSISLAIEVYEDEKAENQEQRIRRHNFYKRCGMDDLPYQTSSYKITLDLMYYGRPPERDEFKDMMSYFAGWPVKYFYKITLSDKPDYKQNNENEK